MNNVYKKRIRDYILINHDNLSRRLPSVNGVSQRNGTAHCYWCLKHIWHVDNINEIPDKDYQLVMDVLHMVVDYAEDPNIEDRLPVLKRNKPGTPNTLEGFF